MKKALEFLLYLAGGAIFALALYVFTFFIFAIF
jgi:hypothetical protein